MSYADILEGIHEALGGVDGIRQTLAYEPASVQKTPAIYSLLDSISREYPGGSTVNVTYRTLHRVLVSWQDSQQAEKTLIELVDSLPAAIDADPTCGGVAYDIAITAGDTGWVTIDGNDYRSLDLYSEALDIAPVR